MKSDLHVHSNYSDGADSVETVIKRASANGVTQISFVDHDTVDGLPEVRMIGEKYGMEIIPGIEMSAYDFKRDRKVHILGYNYDPEAPHITSVCWQVLKRRQAHSLWQIEQIKEAGFALDAEEVVKLAKPGGTVYKQHIMSYLTEAPYSSPEYKQIYQTLFKGDGAASGDIHYMDAFDAVKAIVEDGGLAVIAHPGQLDSYELIRELIEAGLSGIERNHPDHTIEDHHKVEALAKEYHLLMTGGTDYHGAFGEAVEPGEVLSQEYFITQK